MGRHSDNLLFDMPEDKSPRLKWIEKHEIKILVNLNSYVATKVHKETATDLKKAKITQTEDQDLNKALQALAHKLGIEVWNWN